jgi:hypothetical protein
LEVKTNELGAAAAAAAAAAGSASSSSPSLSEPSARARSQAADAGRGGGLRGADGGRAAVADGLAVAEGGGRALEAEAEAGTDCLSSFCPTTSLHQRRMVA